MPEFDLPEFNLPEYEKLIYHFIITGYKFDVISRLSQSGKSKTIYLRHDIDMHITGIERMAEIEAKYDVKSTYYILLTQHYNPMQPDNRKILCDLAAMGHEIGLHYDMEVYPADYNSARAHLDWETSLLADVVGKPVRTIVMHQPHKGQPDPFLSLDEYVHPHDPRYQENLTYISDSCRAWRDESLLECFGSNPPKRLLFATHPELWLSDAVTERMAYLQVLIENATYPCREYFEKTVRHIWQEHPGPKLHDEREALMKKNG